MSIDNELHSWFGQRGRECSLYLAVPRMRRYLDPCQYVRSMNARVLSNTDYYNSVDRSSPVFVEETTVSKHMIIRRTAHDAETGDVQTAMPETRRCVAMARVPLYLSVSLSTRLSSCRILDPCLKLAQGTLFERRGPHRTGLSPHLAILLRTQYKLLRTSYFVVLWLPVPGIFFGSRQSATWMLDDAYDVRAGCGMEWFAKKNAGPAEK